MTPDAATEVSVGGYQINRRVLTHIVEASRRTGIDFQYMLAKAGQESGFTTTAKASNSTATGLYQFTTQTWLELMKVHGEKYGYKEFAEQIKRRKNGRGYTVRNRTFRKAILNLRKNSRASALLAAEYTKSNHRILKNSLRRAINSEDLYLAHFLGAAGAIKLIKAVSKNPLNSAVKLFPDAAKSNPRIFYKKYSKKHRSVKEVDRIIKRLFHNAISRFTNLPPAVFIAIHQVLPSYETALQTLTAPVAKQKSRSFKALKFDAANNYKTGIDLDDYSFFISAEDSMENSAISFTYELETFNLEIESADSIEKITIKQINSRKDISLIAFDIERIGQKQHDR